MVTTVNSLASDLANLAFGVPLRGERGFLNKTDKRMRSGDPAWPSAFRPDTPAWTGAGTEKSYSRHPLLACSLRTISLKKETQGMGAKVVSEPRPIDSYAN